MAKQQDPKIKDGRMRCPICKGTGTVSEDAEQYSFITREPETNKCLVCNGIGKIGPRKILPDGVPAYEHSWAENLEKRKEKAEQKRLNVSRKAVINPEVVDTGVGYAPSNTEENRESFKKEKKRKRGHEPYEAPLLVEMALNPRLNKVLASGKEFLIVTETEPYYLEVYRMIRKQEKKQDTWTKQDEERYVEALEEGYDSLMLDSGLRRNDNVGWNDKTSIRDKKEAFNG